MEPGLANQTELGNTLATLTKGPMNRFEVGLLGDELGSQDLGIYGDFMAFHGAITGSQKDFMRFHGDMNRIHEDL